MYGLTTPIHTKVNGNNSERTKFKLTGKTEKDMLQHKERNLSRMQPRRS